MSLSHYLLAGLGNPGPEYARTRHNFGARLLYSCTDAWNAAPLRRRFDGLFAQVRLETAQVSLLFPQTYMNLSGRSVAAAVRQLGLDPEYVIVLHDDVDLPFGRVRVKSGGGNGGHNGLKSITACLGTPEYIRVRLGVGRPPREMTEYVLGAFDAEERQALPEILENSVKIVETILNKGVTCAMNAFNGTP